MVPSNDIRVRSLMQRFKIKGYALWAYLADALRDAPPEGIPIRGAALSVIADFFPMPLETAAAIVARCVEVGLFRIDGGRLLAPEQPAPGLPPEPPARGWGDPEDLDAYYADPEASLPPAAPAGDTPIAPAQPAPAPAPAAPAGPAGILGLPADVEVYLDGNVCRTRPRRPQPPAGPGPSPSPAPAGAPPSAGARPGPAWLYEPLTRGGAPEPPIVRQARENLQRRYAREQAATAPPNA